ncbi:MAG TPA: transcription antitermination factor NusB, partial [Alphaproteobacteria bacterium]|nr:transcription antitermination factor NusB [Alphaproteobacteria bacterium]
LETLLRAVLWAGAYELANRPDIPIEVVINEYVDIAHAFFAGKEPSFVNGVLDRLAREVRSGAEAARRGGAT